MVERGTGSESIQVARTQQLSVRAIFTGYSQLHTLEQRAPLAEKAELGLLRLENQLCFALYAATRSIARTYRERLGPMGLTYPQYLVLIVLWENDGITISQLGQQLSLDSGTMTPLLKRLESMGHVIRERSKEDQRAVKVWLSAKGLDLKDLALDARKYVACRLEMSEPEIAALRGELMRLIGRLDADCAAAAPRAAEV